MVHDASICIPALLAARQWLYQCIQHFPMASAGLILPRMCSYSLSPPSCHTHPYPHCHHHLDLHPPLPASYPRMFAYTNAHAVIIVSVAGVLCLLGVVGVGIASQKVNQPLTQPPPMTGSASPPPSVLPPEKPVGGRTCPAEAQKGDYVTKFFVVSGLWGLAKWLGARECTQG